MPQQNNPQDQTSKNLMPRNLNPLPPKPRESETAGTAHIRFMGPKTGRPHERADVPFAAAANADFGGLTIAAAIARAAPPLMDAQDRAGEQMTDGGDWIEGEVVRRGDD